MNRCWYCDNEYALADSTALDYKELYCSKACELLEQGANGYPDGKMLLKATEHKITVKKEEN